MNDDRMDDRLKKEQGVARRARAMDDRQVTENRAVTDDERLEMFRMQMHNDALPDLPKLPGFHVCWLTTTNPRDPIHRRMQLGYEPVKPDEVPGLEFATQKTGEYVGFIAVNEMLAFKLPESLYQAFMKEAHYDAPLREENKLAETAEIMREQAERSGSRLSVGDGIEDMRFNAPQLDDFS
jgi:hypothetical protein